MARHGGEISVRSPGTPRNGSGPTRHDRHEQAALRAQAVQMRLDGHRMADIAEAVGRDASTVSKWITAELHHRLDTAVEELRAVEEARLDELWMALRPGVKAGDVGSINAAIRVVAERARILGLRAPVKIEANVITTSMIDAEMARLNAQLAAIEARNSAVPGVVLADEELPALEATDVDAVAWGDPWEA